MQVISYLVTTPKIKMNDPLTKTNNFSIISLFAVVFYINYKPGSRRIAILMIISAKFSKNRFKTREYLPIQR